MAAQVDVRDADAVQDWIASVEGQRPINLMIVNAGVFSGFGPGDEAEDPAEIAATVDTNVLGAIHTANSVLPAMIARRSGHIVLISSLAALQPAADAPTYSATKAALLAYGRALRERVSGEGVIVSVVLPGHIGTAQTAIHRGPTPGILSVAEAASRIKRELDRGRTFVAFPKGILRNIRVISLLPWRLRARLNRPYRFHVDKPKPKPGDPLEFRMVLCRRLDQALANRSTYRSAGGLARHGDQTMSRRTRA